MKTSILYGIADIFYSIHQPIRTSKKVQLIHDKPEKRRKMQNCRSVGYD